MQTEQIQIYDATGAQKHTTKEWKYIIMCTHYKNKNRNRNKNTHPLQTKRKHGCADTQSNIIKAILTYTQYLDRTNRKTDLNNEMLRK